MQIDRTELQEFGRDRSLIVVYAYLVVCLPAWTWAQGDSPSLIYVIRRGFVRVVRKMVPEVITKKKDKGSHDHSWGPWTKPPTVCAPPEALVHVLYVGSERT